MGKQILFVVPSPLGDALLTTGVLNYLIEQNPGAAVTVICSKVNQALFRAAPGVVRTITIEKKRYGLHWIEAYLTLRRRHWDVVADFRNVAIFRLLRSKVRFHAAKRNFTSHKVEQNAQVLGIPAQDPKLWIDEAARSKAAALLPANIPLIGFGPMSSSPFKEWPPERFAELARRLTDEHDALPGASIVVFGTSQERNRAGELMELLPPQNTIDLMGKTDPLEAAACLARLSLFVGNDSGPMHIAAAAGTPTLGLFGTGWPAVYRPWGKKTAYIARHIGLSPDELRRVPHEQMPGMAMTDIQVDEVLRAAEELLGKATRGY
ncbi:MAG: glycosyltransferase family 9 protein [Alphaproteobacteria bacterium]